MILAFCIDDQGGLAFNHRRQSRDRALVADLLAAAGARPVFCLPYSAGLFDPGAVTVVDAPGAVSADGILFLENADPAAYIPLSFKGAFAGELWAGRSGLAGRM